MAIHFQTHSHHSHYTPVLDIRSNCSSAFLDCMKKCFYAFWEFIQRLFSKNPDDAKQITIDDVDNIVVSNECTETHPCQHYGSIVFLKDGRDVTGLNALEICSIVNRIARDRINISCNPDNPWNGDAVVEHFKQYTNRARPAEEVLNRIFPRRD